jgi:hypothetical protein
MSCIIHGANARVRRKTGAGERNRTAVISLEGACPPCNFKAFSDKSVPFAPIVPKRLIGAVRTVADAAGAHHEVLVRYAWHARRQRKAPRRNLIARVRLRELERLFQRRYGHTLPNDDAGRDDLILAAHHIAQLGGEIVKRIVCWASLWARWMPRAEAEALAEKVAVAPCKYKATTLGWRLRLTDNERTGLRITTIRAFDVPEDEMAERRKQCDRERKRMARLRQRATKPEPVSRSRPWQACGISRATWYRRRKMQDTLETRRVRSKVLSIAADGNCLTVSDIQPERLSSGAIPRLGTLGIIDADLTLVDRRNRLVICSTL